MTVHEIEGPFADELTSLVETGASGALDAISKMTDREGLSLSPAVVLRSVELGHIRDLERQSVLVRLDVVASAVEFRLFLVFPEWSAAELAGRLIGGVGGMSGLEESVIGELGNIQGSAFLDSVSSALGVPAVPTPPMTMTGPANACLAASILSESLACTVRFEGPRAGIDGRFVLVLDRENARTFAVARGLSHRDSESLF